MQQIGDYACDVKTGKPNGRLTYIIYPGIEPLPEEWLSDMVTKYATSVAVVYVPAPLWNDSLTPWPEPGETRGAQPFGGKAPEFLTVLLRDIIPGIESGLEEVKERNLIGVSLSGLFTLWQWMQGDTFHSIASLSGSFWYEGFIEWFDAQPVPAKSGKAFFLLGDKEPQASVKAFRSVGINTERIVDRLKQAGVDTVFRWVPGDHFADPLGRAQLAYEAL